MKKIMNSPETFVPEMCNGIAVAYPDLEFIPKYKIIRKREINENKVSLISGGGSGHEPAHAGYVGKGMLDAAVLGDVFASPSQIQVYQALRETTSNKGTLMIIKNYSGDMMNFKNGAALAQEDGLSVDYVKVEDDIAVQDSLYTVGRRGVAGTVLVHKVAGAAAEKGMELLQVKRAAEHAASHIKSIGFAFSSCTVPAKGTPTFHIGEGEMEYGVGIHGEPGIRREETLSADELAVRMVNALAEELKTIDGDEVTLLVNGFGGTPLQELYLLNNAAAKVLNKKNLRIYRAFVGNFMTSIDMMGASVSLMKMDDELKELLDSPSDAPAFPVYGPVKSMPYIDRCSKDEQDSEKTDSVTTDYSFAKIQPDRISLNNIIYLVDQMSECIIENEVPFCELDSHAGDGDFGMSVAKGFRQLKREWKDIIKNDTEDIETFLCGCSYVIMEYCGGASGPIWGSAFRAAGKAAGKKKELSLKEFAHMLQAAVEGIQKTGERSFGRGAVLGDKTLIDSLIPCTEAWDKCAEDGRSMEEAFKAGAHAAVEGARATESVIARMGRAGTVGERSLGYPDAGAYALGVIFTKLADSVNTEK
ncbi:MAG: dihydroxyacetone kinase subunit DhaK [Eubacteriales bacterium]|nr:dihydroxyacetone kinase subunit DhaK [Eubacteriales bacterium]